VIRKARWTFAVAAVLLGLSHLGFAVASGKWGLDVLWFAGAGLAIVFAGFLALAALQGADGARTTTRLSLFASLVAAAYFASAWTVLPVPQVAAGLAIFAGLTLLQAPAAFGPQRTRTA
jgi:hypothetical protein